MKYKFMALYNALSFWFTKLLQEHPIKMVEQGIYHVIVVIECSGVQHPLISMLFIPYRLSEYPLSWN